jgi:hypothetical protein
MNYIAQSVLSDKTEVFFYGKNNKFAQNCVAQSVGLLGCKGSVIGK